MYIPQHTSYMLCQGICQQHVRDDRRCVVGVQVAAMGRLALVADALNETTVAATVRGNMKAVLAPWLGDTNADKLQYEPSWGGVCSSAGLANGEPERCGGQFTRVTLCQVQGPANWGQVCPVTL